MTELQGGKTVAEVAKDMMISKRQCPPLPQGRRQGVRRHGGLCRYCEPGIHGQPGHGSHGPLKRSSNCAGPLRAPLKSNQAKLCR
jgi:hypothetical protein